MAVSRLIPLFVLLAVSLAGCAPQPKRDEVMVNELVATLGGSYDNIAQSRSSSEHPALRLMVVPVQAPAVGDHVFYVQEMAADDPRRVLSQKVYVLNGVPGREQAIVTQMDLNEPLRWRDGHLHRDVFRSLLTQDMRLRPGCDLLWSRTGSDKPADKSKGKAGDFGFVATTGSSCRTSSRSTGETLKVEQRMELNTEGLSVFEQQRDAAGVLAYGDLADPFFRYARRADAPW